MSKTMKTAAVIALAAMILSIYLYKGMDLKGFYSVAITFGTIAYHLCIRVIVGEIFNAAMKNKVDYNKKYFQCAAWETRFYKKIGVKKWKNKLPAYNPEFFSPEKHTWDEIAQAMCQSELVHTVNVFFSLIAIAGTVWFGSFWAFLITSVLGAAFDLVFVIIQRYNRPRVVRLAKKSK